MRTIRQVAVRSLVLTSVLLALPSLATPLPGVKDKLKKKAQTELEKKTSEAEEPAAPAESASETAPAQEAANPAAQPGEGVWVNYDFVPGARVVYFDDFTRDVVGNFPQRLDLLSGNMEVVEYQGRRWIRATTAATFEVPLPEDLPDRFTVEFDLYAPKRWNSLAIYGAAPDEFRPESQPTQVVFSPWDLNAGLTYAGPKDGNARTELTEAFATQVIHCRIMADGKYFKVYANDIRVANFPNCDFHRSNALQFQLRADTEYPLMIAEIRVAASDKTMYDALVAEGRVALQGILFDTGSDRIRPESTPTLKEIGAMLKAHTDLRLRIEGHTDNVGDEASNLALSEKRAAAVRAYLVAEFALDPARAEAQGFGKSKPVASNDTPEGRQNNRRVELVKI